MSIDKQSPDYRRMVAAKKAIDTKEYAKALLILRQVTTEPLLSKAQEIIPKLEKRIEQLNVEAPITGSKRKEKEKRTAPSSMRSVMGTVGCPAYITFFSVMGVLFIALNNREFAGSISAPVAMGLFILWLLSTTALIYSYIHENKYKAHIRAEEAAERQRQLAEIARERQRQRDEYRRKLVELEQQRQVSINEKRPEWGDDICDALIAKQIGIGMQPDMVKAALGEPANIDRREITKTTSKERWIYGRPRLDATYISFKNDEVVKIRETGQ